MQFSSRRSLFHQHRVLLQNTLSAIYRQLQMENPLKMKGFPMFQAHHFLLAYVFRAMSTSLSLREKVR